MAAVEPMAAFGPMAKCLVVACVAHSTITFQKVQIEPVSVLCCCPCEDVPREGILYVPFLCLKGHTCGVEERAFSSLRTLVVCCGCVLARMRERAIGRKEREKESGEIRWTLAERARWESERILRCREERVLPI